ncbi:tubulin epsilon and delta complex protein 1 isoform X3 [Callithrix jacchus]|uniref:tubulin epsilon and delta complex protein 1 isoform X2 n=1 Tax=Callithrix jacchus TaxID=9483 RepID=UPI00159E3982|nr:tubulin epsilon and delta complex protein 1 isoform X2 [Callithrix jacchus]
MLVRRSRAAAATAGDPKEAGAGSMGRRRRRVDPAAGARAAALPEAIAALSRSLPSGPSPEIFRRAKFDRPEATAALWQLLFRVLVPLPLDNPLASLAQEVQARLVKSALRSRGYPRLALAQLPEDGSQGSRELLLALSWLLARGPVPEQMLAQTRVPLGDEMTVCQCEALASPGPPAPQARAEDPVDVRYVQWLMGKLRFRWRQLVSSQQEQCTLLSKIHLYTRGCHGDQSLGHLSVTEAEMLRDPEGGQQGFCSGNPRNLDLAYLKGLYFSCTPGMSPRTFWKDLWLVCEQPGLLLGDWRLPWVLLLRTLECANRRLEAVLAWRRTELVFWRWMDTVLDTCAPGVPAAASQGTFLPRIPEHRGGELELVAWELRALQEELQEAVECRRAAWEAKWCSLYLPGTVGPAAGRLGVLPKHSRHLRRLEAVDGGQSGVLCGGPLGRPWKRSWELCSGAGSKMGARPSPMGHTGW